MLAKRQKLFFLYLLVIISSNLPAQSKPIEALKKLYNDYPQEKVYVWLNKTGYIAGETAWFKVYVFSGYDLSRISTNLYIELLDFAKKPISVNRYPLMKGSAYGSINLDSALTEGVYYLRAYTDWMLNFDEKFQFIRSIPIYNPQSKFKLLLKNDPWDAAVFPEGGNLIEGLESKVTVRLSSTSALPEKWNGFVEEDESGIKITTLQILDPNVALFNLKPEAGKKYKVIVSDTSGNTKVIPLPEIKTRGAIISAINNGDSVFIELRFKNLPRNGSGYSVVGHIQTQVIYEALIKSSSPIIRQSIRTADYLNGILHLTLFDPDNKPVSERLVFLNPKKLIYDTTTRIDFSFDATSRSKNELTVYTDSTNWNSYAVSILDDDIPHEEYEETLLSNLWLTSDISSGIYNPGSFFNLPDTKKIMALDAIMISEKWNRFNWDSILSSRYPQIKYKPQNFLTFTGNVSSKKEIPAGEGLSLLLGNPGAPSQIVYTKTDSANRINIDNILFMGDFFGYYRLNNGKKYAGRKINIDFTRIDNNIPYQLSLPRNKYTLSEKFAADAQPSWVQHNYAILQNKKANDERFKTLQEVIVKSNFKSKKEQLHDKLTSGRFKISNDYIFDFVNEKQGMLGSPTLFHWLQHRISGLEVIFNTRTFEWDPVYKRFSGSAAKGVLLYLNEGETSVSWLNTISLDNIIMIKVIPYPRTMAFEQNIGLVISVYTERDSIVPAERDYSLRNKMLRGYDIPREYTMPQYDNESLAFPEKDSRSELVWQPVIIPDDSLFRTKMKFFNNDSVKNLRIIIQGFNKDGFPVYINRVIKSEARKAY